MMSGRLLKVVWFVAAGGVILASTTGCTTEFMDSLSTSVADTLTTVLDEGITSYINQLLAG